MPTLPLRAAMPLAVATLALTTPAQGPVTFTEHIAPIVFQNCTVCHRPGEIGPFSLLNYRDVASTAYSSDKIEQLADIEHFVRFNKHGSRLANFDPVIVAQGHYLALGDNRDNSADSRVIGFVPRNEIVGRTKRVVMSLNYENYFIPRLDRFFHRL